HLQQLQAVSRVEVHVGDVGDVPVLMVVIEELACLLEDGATVRMGGHVGGQREVSDQPDWGIRRAHLMLGNSTTPRGSAKGIFALTIPRMVVLQLNAYDCLMMNS